ncbi:MAG: TerB family tellurite resistance protein [Acidimicrobiales bacterium]
MERAVAISDHDDEHRAVVEVLLLTAFADRVLRQAEFESIDRLDDSHAEWDTSTFSVEQAVGPATARVRAAMATEGGEAALLTEISGRIHTPELRREVPELCLAVATVDSELSVEEEQLLDRVRGAFR